MITAHLLTRRLPILRGRFELTQERFAEAAGFEYKFYQAIEAGRRKHLRMDTVERLAQAYGIELWELVGPNDPVMRIRYPSRVGISTAAADRPLGKPGRPSTRKHRDGGGEAKA